jgi:hypothetical protein
MFSRATANANGVNGGATFRRTKIMDNSWGRIGGTPSNNSVNSSAGVFLSIVTFL